VETSMSGSYLWFI